ncbi:EF-hand domain-containing protein [Polymorphobacter sp.]|uniref:EF-hand domain-containing protein n=1 Tax=Polymorphobacter sp. TaxID=1909290 RepID=UPI003F7282FA
MRRLLALCVAFLALAAAGFLWTRDRPIAEAQVPPPPPSMRESLPVEIVAEPVPVPKAPVTDVEREARRFNRYDKDKDGVIDRDEYLANRQKAFAKLDLNRDGRLDFEEYAAATARKFKKADRSGDGRLAPAEFATTAIKRKPKPACACEAGEN